MAKMIQRGVSIYIDQQDAERAVEALQVKFDNFNKKLKELESTGKKGNGEWKKTTAEIKKTDAALGLVSKELKTTEMSMSQLRAVSARLQNQLNKTKPNTPEWEKYNNALAETRVEITRLNSKQRETEAAFLKMNGVTREHSSSMTKLANSFNKYQALALGFIASITGVAFAIKNTIKEFAQLDDVFANVSKNTGLTIEEVKELDERLKSYDTRTAREELLKLASEAGKAGETGVENLNGIVQSLDKIKVALGEDLGEDAITDLLKIANVSGLKDMMGTADAINAIGSAVNELGQKSVAKEAYIISFTQRLGGVAKQANISAQNIMGFASALDQAGMNVEMSSTALQQFLMKMMEDPAKFAKIAGLEVKSFTELVAKDTNAAIIQMLEAMHSKGGFQALIPMFSDMGTEGVRAVSVLSTLAGQIQGVKEAQELSNIAFTEGNSLTEEFNKRNNNAQAELDKAKKKFLETSVALGEKLYPAMKVSINGTSYLIKILGVLVNNFGTLMTVVTGLTTAYIIQNSAHLRNIATKRLAILFLGKQTTATNLATVAQQLFNKAIKLNPFGILITAITATIALFDIFSKKTKETKTATEEGNASLASNISLLEQLRGKWKTLGDDLDKRKKFIHENKSAFDQLGIAINTVAEAENLLVGNTNAFIGAMIKRSLIESYKEKMNEIAKGLAEIKAEEQKEKEKSGGSVFGASVLSPGINYSPLGKDGLDTAEDEMKRYVNLIEKTQKEIDQILTNANFSSTSTNPFDPTTSTITPTGSNADDDKKPWEKKIKALEDNLKLSKAINEKALLEKNINEEQYNRLNLEADALFFKKKLEVLKLNKQATGDVELEIAKNKAELQKLGFNQELMLVQEAKDNYLLELEKKLQNGKMSEKTYNLNIIAAEVAFLQKRLDIMKKYGDNTINIETDILQKKKALNDAWEKLVETEDEKLVDDPNENPALSESTKLDIEEIKIKAQYKKNLINKKEYEDAMADITKKRVDGDLEMIKGLFEQIETFTQKGIEATTSFREADLTNAETRFNKEEKALDNKFKKGLISQEDYDTQKNALEEKHQNEQKEIKKKYAGVDLAINIAKIISETALAVMKSYSASPLTFGLPWSAISAVAGAGQIALATAQYNQIQGLEEGLYPTVTRKQDGKKFKVNSVGNMQTGVYSQPSVLVGEAGPELVVDNKRFNRIMKERPEVINYIVNGFEKGKYPSISKNALNAGKSNYDKQLLATMQDLNSAIANSDIYLLRKKLRKADKTINDINVKFK